MDSALKFINNILEVTYHCLSINTLLTGPVLLLLFFISINCILGFDFDRMKKLKTLFERLTMVNHLSVNNSIVLKPNIY